MKRILQWIALLIVIVPQMLWQLVVGKENYYNMEALNWSFWKQLSWLLRGKPPLPERSPPQGGF